MATTLNTEYANVTSPKEPVEGIDDAAILAKGVRVDVKAHSGVRVEGTSNAEAPSEAFKATENQGAEETAGGVRPVKGKNHCNLL